MLQRSPFNLPTLSNTWQPDTPKQTKSTNSTAPCFERLRAEIICRFWSLIWPRNLGWYKWYKLANCHFCTLRIWQSSGIVQRRRRRRSKGKRGSWGRKEPEMRPTGHRRRTRLLLLVRLKPSESRGNWSPKQEAMATDPLIHSWIWVGL